MKIKYLFYKFIDTLKSIKFIDRRLVFARTVPIDRDKFKEYLNFIWNCYLQYFIANKGNTIYIDYTFIDKKIKEAAEYIQEEFLKKYTIDPSNMIKYISTEYIATMDILVKDMLTSNFELKNFPCSVEEVCRTMMNPSFSRHVFFIHLIEGYKPTPFKISAC